MRLDKYLKISRLIKRRTVANEACDAGRVFVNEKQARASYDVKEGDVLELHLGERVLKAQVPLCGGVRQERAGRGHVPHAGGMIPAPAAYSFPRPG